MDVKILLLVLSSVSLSAAAQITLKYGMSGGKIQHALNESLSRLDMVIVIASNLFVIFGLFLYVLSALLWLLVLARIDVSIAYPFVGIAFVLTMIFAYFLLGEPVSVQRIIGTFLVITGIFLISQS